MMVTGLVSPVWRQWSLAGVRCTGKRQELLSGPREACVSSPGCLTGGDKDVIHAGFMHTGYSPSFMDNPYPF